MSTAASWKAGRPRLPRIGAVKPRRLLRTLLPALSLSLIVAAIMFIGGFAEERRFAGPDGAASSGANI